MAKELSLVDFNSEEVEQIQKDQVLWRALLMAVELANGVVDIDSAPEETPDRMVEYVEAFTYEKFPNTASVLSRAFWGSH